MWDTDSPRCTGSPCAHARTLAHALSVGPRVLARCEFRLPQRRDALHADVLAAHRSSDVSMPSTSVGVSICRSLARGTSLGATVCSRQRCALLGRCSCSAVDATGWASLRRSQLCKHTEAPFRNLCRSLRESIHWLRKPSRFPLRPRRRCVHSGRAVGRRLPGEPVVVFRWTVDRRLLVASSGRTLEQGRLRLRLSLAGSLALADATLGHPPDTPKN